MLYGPIKRLLSSGFLSNRFELERHHFKVVGNGFCCHFPQFVMWSLFGFCMCCPCLCVVVLTLFFTLLFSVLLCFSLFVSFCFTALFCFALLCFDLLLYFSFFLRLHTAMCRALTHLFCVLLCCTVLCLVCVCVRFGA